MRRLALPCALLLSACARQPSAPASNPSPDVHQVTGTISYVSADSMLRLRANLPPPDSAMLRHQAWADSLTALVDTIVALAPDSILLHVGEAIEDLQVVRYEGRRHSGEVIRGGPGYMFDVEDMTIAQHRQAGLTGLRVGRTRLIISILRPGHASPAYIPVRVVP